MDIDKIQAVNVVRCVVSIISIVGNSFLLYLFYSNPHLRRAHCNILVMMLNVCDLLIGIGVFIRVSYTLYINSNNITVYNRLECLYFNHVQGLGIIGGQVVLVGIAVDRFYAIFKPLQYSRSKSRKWIYFLTFLAVILPLNSMVVKTVGVTNDVPLTICSAGSAASRNFAIVNVIYSLSFLTLIFVFYTSALILVVVRIKSKFSGQEKKEYLIQRKVFVSVSFILITAVVTFGVPMVIQMVGLLYPLSREMKGFITVYIGLGTMINSALNVFIYLFKHGDINKCFKALLLKHVSPSTTQVFDTKVSNIGISHPKVSNSRTERNN